MLVLLSSSSFAQPTIEDNGEEFWNGPTDSYYNSDAKVLESANVALILDAAELSATSNAKDILLTARTMIQQKEIVIGSCWDYIDAIFNNAGYKQSHRKTVFKGSKSGTFAKQTTLQPGDWLYFINYSYKNIGHSAIFVAWTDYAKKEALLISYSGGNQVKPARYHVYNVKSVYNVMRAQ